MNTKVTRIVAAVVDTSHLTLYKTNGETIVIPQGDPRLRRIVEEATPQLIRQGWAEVDVGAAADNSYAQFEKEGSGKVSFFRIAKDKLKNLFTPVAEPAPVDTSPVPVMSIGAVPQAKTPLIEDIDAAMQELRVNYSGVPSQAQIAVLPIPADDMKGTVAASATPAQDHIATAGIYDVSEEDEVEAVVEQAEAKPSEPKVEQAMATINEIMKHAVPVSSEDFHENGVAAQGNVVEDHGGTDDQRNENRDEPNTIIAVVNGKIIPGMERIKTQFSRAAKLGHVVGVEAFLQRLALVIEQRSHSVEDLLAFMERADTPIADDGSIIIYKVLNKSKGETKHYVDCHSRKVEQWVGAYVCMDPSLVDRNRNTECSNGLHVARRGYIRSFSGDVCVLAKLAPEDVITVPTYDANKMRVCGYHIIAELPADLYSELKSNRPITSVEEGKRLLARAIAGQHIGKTHEVRITGQMGAGVQVKELVSARKAKPVEEAPAASPVPVPVMAAEALANPTAEMLDTPTAPLEVIKAVEKEQLSRKEQAKILYDACAGGGQPALDALHAFKKASKISWENLGLPELNGSTFSIKAKAPPKPAFPKAEGKVTVKATKKVRKAKAKAEAKKTAPKVKPVPQVHAVDFGDEPQDRAGGPTEAKEGSARERIQKRIAIGITTKADAEAIYSIKKASKKSWTVLGVSDVILAKMLKLIEG